MPFISKSSRGQNDGFTAANISTLLSVHLFYGRIKIRLYEKCMLDVMKLMICGWPVLMCACLLDSTFSMIDNWGFPQKSNQVQEH